MLIGNVFCIKSYLRFVSSDRFNYTERNKVVAFYSVSIFSLIDDLISQIYSKMT